MDERSEIASTGQRRGFVIGVAWVLALRILDRVVGLLSILVLSRLLLPEHFGIVSLGFTVVAFVDLFASLGLDTILVQMPDVTRRHYDTAWTIQLLAAVLCALLLVGAAEPAGWFFREPRLVPIIYLLAFSTLLYGARNIRLVDFRREMRFDKEFIFLGVRRLSGVAVTIPAAFVLRNQWALVCGVLAGSVVGLAFSYLMRPYLPKLTLACRRELLGKANWLLASSFVMFVRARASDFVLGRIGGASVVGAYNLASEVATFASTELVAPINRVAMSDFSARRTRVEVVQRLEDLTGILAVVLIPVGVGLSVAAEWIVPVLFGSAWIHVVGPLQILALAGLVAALGSNFGVALLSLGHFSRDTLIHGWGAVLLLPMLTLGGYVAGATGAALAVLAGNTMTVLIALAYMKNDIGYGLGRFVRSLLWPGLAAAVMYATVAILNAYPAESLRAQPAVLRLVEAVATGAVTYIGALLATWWLRGRPDGPERRVLGTAKAVLALGFARAAKQTAERGKRHRPPSPPSGS